MTKFGKCTESFSSNKVVSKIVSTRIVVSTRQLAKLVKTVNKRNKMGRVCKFDLITQNGWVDCEKLKVLNCRFLQWLGFIESPLFSCWIYSHQLSVLR